MMEDQVLAYTGIKVIMKGVPENYKGESLGWMLVGTLYKLCWKKFRGSSFILLPSITFDLEDSPEHLKM